VSYLFDTNVFCEPVKPKPGAEVVAWLRANESSLFVSTITIGEIRRGIERLPAGGAGLNCVRGSPHFATA
jgi:predicted nucleic acid-binding protein